MANTNENMLTEDEYYDKMAEEWAEEQKAISCYDDKLDKEVEEIMYLQQIGRQLGE